MTDSVSPDPTKVASLAQQLVKLLVAEDTQTRVRAISAAMTMLGETYTAKQEGHDQADRGEGVHQEDLAKFFQRDEKLKPSDNAFLVVAYLYSLYGSVPFSLSELREVAQEAGLVLPDRLDMTLRNAGKGGKKLFLIAGKDAYKPTAAAGTLFLEKWSVKPGKRSKPKIQGE